MRGAVNQSGPAGGRGFVYLRPQAGRNDPGYYLQSGTGHRVFFEYRVIRLSQMDGLSVLAAGPAGLIPFAPLMADPADVAADAWLHQCVQAVHALPMDRSARSDLLSGLSIFSGLVYPSETISDIISREGIMDIMRESSFGRLLAREWKKEGLREGREEGLEQGIEQGLRESIRDVLEIALPWARPTLWPTASRPSAIGTASSSCTGPRSRLRAWRNSGASQRPGNRKLPSSFFGISV